MVEIKSTGAIEFMSRFEKFKVDEISIGEADDFCINAKDTFEDSAVVSLIGLRYTEDENTNEWGKRKLEYLISSNKRLEKHL